MKRLQTRGWGPFRQEWYSICSKHHFFKETCDSCTVGSWNNVWWRRTDSLWFKVSPKTWRFVHNLFPFKTIRLYKYSK